MSGLEISRGITGAAVAAACLALPIAGAPQAMAAASPDLSVAMTGSPVGRAGFAAVGCGQTAVATVKNADGTPVTRGNVQFASRLPGLGATVVGTVPVTNGTASILWIPGAQGQHTVSAIYYDDGSDVRPVSGQTTVNAVNTAGVCV